MDRRGLLGETFDPQAIDVLEVAAVIGKQGQAALAGGDPNDEVEVGNALPYGPKPAALLAEQLTSFLIDPDEGDTPQEIVQAMFALQRIAGVVHPFPQLGERDGG